MISSLAPHKKLNPKHGYFTKLRLENVRCFGSPAETLSLTDQDNDEQPARWTVILGANGVGKTTLLRALALLDAQFEPESQIIHLVWDRFKRSNSKHSNIWYSSSKAHQEVEARISFEGGQRIIAKASSANADRLPLALIVAYGAGRNWSDFSVGDDWPQGTLFDRDAAVRNPSETLSRLEFRKLKEEGSEGSRFDAYKNALTSGVLPDVTELRTGFSKSDKPIVEFRTVDGWISLEDMSWGYQVFAAFTADYASRLIDRYPDSETPLAEPGICLVDELDLHMHPKWQREVISHLSAVFPATQFIVTAHSPLVVQAAEQANLVLLERYESDKSRVRIRNDIEAIKGWRIDQVLTSDLFGLESSRPPTTADFLNERNNLLQKSDLSVDEKSRLLELDKMAMDIPTEDQAWEEKAKIALLQIAEKIKSAS